MLDADDWRCPMCLDLLYRPAVNSACGHFYCFWCLHRAMSPYTPSACPVCRARYTNLPAICAKLHRFLECQFAAEYAARRAETEGPGQWTPAHFACDNPRCGRLLCRPAVLNCGHVVCSPTCLTSSGSSSSAAAAPAAAAAAGPPRHDCPACGMAARQPPAVCRQLADLVAQLFPEESRQREQEVQVQLEAAAEVQAADSGRQPAPAAGDHHHQQQQQQLRQEPATPHASAAPSEGGPNAAGSTVGDDSPPPALAAGGGAAQQAGQDEGEGAGPRQALSPSLQSALQRRAGAGGADEVLARRVEDNLRRLAGPEYVHHGVGCDACGMYPIQGQRWSCADCPEAMGFDLCQDCCTAGCSNIVGRFNQRHTPQHRMHLVRPRITAMHLLQARARAGAARAGAANPELSMDQLLWLLEMTLGGGADDEQGGAAAEGGEQLQQPAGQQPAGQQPAGQQPAGQQQQQQQAEAGGGGSSGLPLRRGPRPAHDPSAQEPSPSAYVLPQQQQQQQQQPLGGEAAGLIDDES